MVRRIRRYLPGQQPVPSEMGERAATMVDGGCTLPPAAPGVAPKVYRIDPLSDPRWMPFVEQHPRASVFHCPAWLRALLQTYGYSTVAYTTSDPGGKLGNAAVFCRVESWLTGRRLVSLPFSDHCDPLVDSEEDSAALRSALEEDAASFGFGYIEVRLSRPVEFRAPWLPVSTFALHQLHLQPDLETLFCNLHKDSIQRKIRRAERERLNYDEGATGSHLDSFYRLFAITRQRHGLPPPPRRWFENLIACFGDALKIRISLRERRPVAAILTVCHKGTMFYKYGGSDVRYNNLGGTCMLLWAAIKEAKITGLRRFDLGRSDPDQAGLITFKDRWGASKSLLTYSRYVRTPNSALALVPLTGPKAMPAKRVMAHLPTSVLNAMGRLLYKHVG
jgi:Acetyltransferase (GNAT) domain